MHTRREKGKKIVVLGKHELRRLFEAADTLYDLGLHKNSDETLVNLSASVRTAALDQCSSQGIKPDQL